MRLREIHAVNIPPIKQFDVEQLSDIVVLAGPNGVGKTRFVASLLSRFQSMPQFAQQIIQSRAPARRAQGPPHVAHPMRLVIEATCDAEVREWKKKQLDTDDPNDIALLATSLQKARRRKGLHGTVLNFESDRTIQNIQPYAFSFETKDPFVEVIGWAASFTPLKARFQDTLHSIFRKVHSRRENIAVHLDGLLKQHHPNEKAPPELLDTLTESYPDPIEPFRDAFNRLLAPKILVDPDLKTQKFSYEIDGQMFPIDSLSSGESEVVNIVFDFLLRSPSDCIIIFDEPELHLHPELSYRLIQTLRTVGKNNQFIFCTHSADIITASLEDTVIFIAPPRADSGNQAIKVRDDDQTNQALKLLGQSIGIVSLGRRLVLIEGKNASLDKLTYSAILQNRFPGLVLVPSGGRAVMTSFEVVQRDVLDRTIWGIQFFMLCDRDASPIDHGKASERLQILKKYHLENYFLDENVLASIFEDLGPSGAEWRSPANVRKLLKELAGKYVSYAVALMCSAHFRDQVGNLNIMPKDCHGKNAAEIAQMLVDQANEESARIQVALNAPVIEAFVSDTTKRISDSLEADNDEWKVDIPGKPLLGGFAGRVGLNVGYLKSLYIMQAERQTVNPFAEIISIFEGFNSLR